MFFLFFPREVDSKRVEMLDYIQHFLVWTKKITTQEKKSSLHASSQTMICMLHCDSWIFLRHCLFMPKETKGSWNIGFADSAISYPGGGFKAPNSTQLYVGMSAELENMKRMLPSRCQLSAVAVFSPVSENRLETSHRRQNKTWQANLDKLRSHKSLLHDAEKQPPKFSHDHIGCIKLVLDRITCKCLPIDKTM